MNANTLTPRTSRRLGLRVNFSWMLAGSIVYSACQWGELVVLTKLGSPVMVGQFVLGLSIVMPIMAFATLKTRLVQATDAQQSFAYADYLSLRTITTLLALAVIAMIVLFADYNEASNAAILAIALAKGIESISDVIYGLFQQRERMDHMAKSLLLRGPLALVALSLGVYVTGNVAVGALAMASVWVLVLLFFDLRNAAWTLRASSASRPPWYAGIQTNWDRAQLWSLAWLSLPLGIVVALESLGTNIPRYFIERELGLYALGIFAAMAYLKRAGTVVITALGLSASAQLAMSYAERRLGDFKRLLLRLMGLGALIGGAGLLFTALFGRPVMAIMYQPEYALYQEVLLVIIAAAAVDFIGIGVDYAVTATRRFRHQMVLFATIVVTIVIASAILVPPYGLMGAAVALLIAAVVRLAGGLLIVAWALRAHPLAGAGSVPAASETEATVPERLA